MPKANAQDSERADRRGAATRQALIDATVALVASQGWGALTTRAVAERAGLAAGLVHYHFAGLDDLRLQALAQVLDTLAAPAERAAHDLASATPGDASPFSLRALVSDYLAGLDSPEGADHTAFALEATLAARHDPQVAALVRGAIERGIDQAAAALVAAGHADSQPVARAQARLVVAVLDGLALQRFATPEADLGAALDLLATAVEHENPHTSREDT